MKENKTAALDPIRENARAAYNWLRFSPLLTLPTFLVILGSEIGYEFVCPQGYRDCDLNAADGLTNILAILGSALWHLLLLLQFAGQKETFARWHTKQAMWLAGIRTALPLGFTLFGMMVGTPGPFVFLAFIAVLVAYFVGNSWGRGQAANGDCWLMRRAGLEAELPMHTDQPETQDASEAAPVQASAAPPQEQKETLDRLLADLQSTDQKRALAAMTELGALNFSSPAIVRQLERLALHENAALRTAALDALDLRTSIFVASKQTSLVRSVRETIVNEIEHWRNESLLDAANADVLRRRYDFDTRAARPVVAPAAQPAPVAKAVEIPAAPKSESVAPAVPQVQAAAPAPLPKPEPVPAAPKRSLAQIVFSESAVKIYLYLGAFFVIVAAAIWAFLDEAARLPLLLVTTAIFAVGAVALKRRLPQPSFALAIVFSFLLPLDANVLSDSLTLSVRGNHGYWAFVFLLMAVIWALGTWFYTSRLFSVAAYVSLVLSALRFSQAFETTLDWNMLAITLANLAALAGVAVLKRWKGQPFAMPVFVLAHLAQLLVLPTALASSMIQSLNYSAETNIYIAASLTWTIAASFYVASNILIPFVIFPWMAVASAFLLPWFTVSSFSESGLAYTVGFAVWGLVHAATSELVQRTKREGLGKYHYPLLAWSLPLFLVSVIWGLIEENQYAFAAFLCMGMAYTVLHVLRPRWYVWMTALLAGLGAYFMFFFLPFMEGVEMYAGYRLLGAAALLLIPELFFKEKFSFSRPWSWPPMLLGALLASLNIFITLTDVTSGLRFGLSDFGNAAVVMGVSALLAAAYTLRFRWPLLGYMGAALAAFSLDFAMNHFNSDWWLPALTALSAIYYAASFLPRGEENRRWSAMLTNSGLALGAIISVLALVRSEQFGGWYVLVVAALFFTELYARRNAYLEIAIELLLSTALVLLFDGFNIREVTYLFFGLGLTWLACDALFQRTFAARTLPIVPRIFGGVLSAVAIIAIAMELPSGAAAICFAAYALFFAAYAWAYREPRLGYLSTASVAAATHFALDHFNIATWLPIFTALAAGYYVAGFFLRQRTASLAAMLRTSGLVFGLILSLRALILPESTGGWYVALIGALFVVEMFTSRNGWLEIGVHALLSAAAWLLLVDVGVDSSAYHLLASSLVWLVGDMIFQRTFSARTAAILVRGVGHLAAVVNVGVLLLDATALEAGICFGVYGALYALYAWLYQKPWIGYASTSAFALAVTFGLRAADLDLWLPALVALAVTYYAAGYFLRQSGRAPGWDAMLRQSGLALGLTLSAFAVNLFEPYGGWYVAVIGALFVLEMYTTRNGWFEFGVHLLFSAAAFLILLDFEVNDRSYHLLAISLVWLIGDMIFQRTFAGRKLPEVARLIGHLLAALNVVGLVLQAPEIEAAICFAAYTVVYAAYAWFYRMPLVAYTSTASLPLAVFYGLRAAQQEHWLLPVIAVAVVYYAAGFSLRRDERAHGWNTMLLFSGLGLGTLVALVAPYQSGGLENAIPVAITATFYAAEAFARRNVWLGFPANVFYFVSYFIILNELNVDEPQFFTVGAGALGLLQHYLLNRAGQKLAAFITGLVSQLVLLGASYSQMINTSNLTYFLLLFFQALAVIAYGIVIRSRSLIIAPIGFLALAAVTVLYNALRDISLVFILGIAGLILLGLGILAVVMRERITNLADRFSDWDA